MKLHRLSVMILVVVLLTSAQALRSETPAGSAGEGTIPLIIGAGLVALAVVRRRVST